MKIKDCLNNYLKIGTIATIFGQSISFISVREIYVKHKRLAFLNKILKFLLTFYLMYICMQATYKTFIKFRIYKTQISILKFARKSLYFQL